MFSEFNLSILFCVGGCVEKRFVKPFAEKGFIINKDAVDLFPNLNGIAFDACSIFFNAVIMCLESFVNLADVSSAMNSLEREIAN